MSIYVLQEIHCSPDYDEAVTDESCNNWSNIFKNNSVSGVFIATSNLYSILNRLQWNAVSAYNIAHCWSIQNSYCTNVCKVLRIRILNNEGPVGLIISVSTKIWSRSSSCIILLGYLKAIMLFLVACADSLIAGLSNGYVLH